MWTINVKQTRVKRAVALFDYDFFDSEGNLYMSFRAQGFNLAVDHARYLIDKAGGYSENYKFEKIK